MKYPTVYLIGNCLYVKLCKSLDNEFPPKYMSMSVNGLLFTDEIYTQKELLNKHSNIKSFETLKEAVVERFK